MSFLRLIPSPAKLLLLGLLSLGIAAPVSAQDFVGSSDFTDGSTSGWAFAYRLSGTNGALTFTNNQLDVTQAASGTANRFLSWDGDPSDVTVSDDGARTSASYTTSWIMDVSVTNTLASLSEGQFLSVGAQARSGSDYFSTFLLATAGGWSVTNEYTGGYTTQVSSATADNTDVILRISWDASSQLLSSSYSFDNGATFDLLRGSYSVSGWTANAPTSGFNYELFMNSNLGAELIAGTASMDNFSLTAVPEPSTYAAIAGGLMLGFAAWKRRRQQQA